MEGRGCSGRPLGTGTPSHEVGGKATPPPGRVSHIPEHQKPLMESASPVLNSSRPKHRHSAGNCAAGGLVRQRDTALHKTTKDPGAPVQDPGEARQTGETRARPGRSRTPKRQTAQEEQVMGHDYSALCTFRSLHHLLAYYADQEAYNAHKKKFEWRRFVDAWIDGSDTSNPPSNPRTLIECFRLSR